MGRGRQKAKQTKVARQLKYYSPDTDYSALQRELAGPSVHADDDSHVADADLDEDDAGNDEDTDEDDQDDQDDEYAGWSANHGH